MNESDKTGYESSHDFQWALTQMLDGKFVTRDEWEAEEEDESGDFPPVDRRLGILSCKKNPQFRQEILSRKDPDFSYSEEDIPEDCLIELKEVAEVGEDGRTTGGYTQKPTILMAIPTEFLFYEDWRFSSGWGAGLPKIIEWKRLEIYKGERTIPT